MRGKKYSGNNKLNYYTKQGHKIAILTASSTILLSLMQKTPSSGGI